MSEEYGRWDRTSRFNVSNRQLYPALLVVNITRMDTARQAGRGGKRAERPTERKAIADIPSLDTHSIIADADYKESDTCHASAAGGRKHLQGYNARISCHPRQRRRRNYPPHRSKRYNKKIKDIKCAHKCKWQDCIRQIYFCYVLSGIPRRQFYLFYVILLIKALSFCFMKREWACEE
ncbi:uncharacterized protein LOC118647672 [Monomorium pharaonis]|uniref:uncharacterized protein LOC118647672 n=1 Tax=Monomorium pharaonis TaxID=307658 RepID=UPI0017479F83|nr:uncharacterized protein LOC118647672 [Monomorium pharaonis]